MEIGAGATLSAFTTAPALSETAECGWFFASSTKQAVGIEAIQKLQIAVDHTTPELGMLGAGLRRAGRRDIAGRRMIDFERIHFGLAVATRGSNLDAGVGAGVALGFATFGGKGLSVGVDGYFLTPGDLSGPDKVFMLTLAYVYSPAPGTRVGPQIVETPTSQHAEPKGGPCRDLDAYKKVLVQERKAAVLICNQGPSTQCDVHKQKVVNLNAKAEACYRGEDVGSPEAQ